MTRIPQASERRRDPKQEMATFLKAALDQRRMSLAELRRQLPFDRKTPSNWLKGKKMPNEESQLLLAKKLNIPAECFRRLSAGASARQELLVAFPDLRPDPAPTDQPTEYEAVGDKSWREADRETRRLLHEVFGGDPTAADAARLVLAAVSWELQSQRRKGLTRPELWKVAREAIEGSTRHGWVDLVARLEESGVLIEVKQGIAMANDAMRDVVLVDWLQLHYTIEQYPRWVYFGADHGIRRFLVEAQRSKKQCLRVLARPGFFGYASAGRLGSPVRDFFFEELEHAVAEAEKAFEDLVYRDDEGALDWGFPHFPTEDDPRWQLLDRLASCAFEDNFFPFYRRLVEAAERGCATHGVPPDATPELVAALSQTPLSRPKLPWYLKDIGRVAYDALLTERSVGVLSTKMWTDLTYELWGPLAWDDDPDVRPELGKTEELPPWLLDELRTEARSLGAPLMQRDIEKRLNDIEEWQNDVEIPF